MASAKMAYGGASCRSGGSREIPLPVGDGSRLPPLLPGTRGT